MRVDGVTALDHGAQFLQQKLREAGAVSGGGSSLERVWHLFDGIRHRPGQKIVSAQAEPLFQRLIWITNSDNRGGSRVPEAAIALHHGRHCWEETVAVENVNNRHLGRLRPERLATWIKKSRSRDFE